jgi:hypothetical protein
VQHVGRSWGYLGPLTLPQRRGGVRELARLTLSRNPVISQIIPDALFDVKRKYLVFLLPFQQNIGIQYIERAAALT